MLSRADKLILTGTAVMLASITSCAGRWAWSQLDAGSGLIGGPAVKVADLFDVAGPVKTRHREVLAWTDGVVHDPLHEGDRIRTLADAKAEIHYDDGLVVMMDPNSQITVHAPQTGSNGERLVAAIDVVDGSIRAKVSKNTAIAVSNGARHGQGEITSTGDGAQIEIHASDSADGSTTVKVDQGQAQLAPPTPEPGASPAPTATAIVLNAGDTTNMGGPTLMALATPPPTPAVTPPLPIASGFPPLPNMEGDASSAATSIHWPIPHGVVEIRVRGHQAKMADGFYTVGVVGLQPGVNKVDIEYHFADGHWAKQIQMIRVR